MERSPDPADTVICPDAEKLEALAELAAGAGHEINNPLATISGRVQLLLRNETDPARRQALLSIGAQAYRIRDMIGDLMLFARPPKPDPESLNLTEVLRSVLDRFEESARLNDCCFAVNAEECVPVFADRIQLSVVISSLVHNSLEALEGGGPISITARCVFENNRVARPESAKEVAAVSGDVNHALSSGLGVPPGRQWALLSVSDRGPGLSETDRKHLFDPFYSGRQAGRGLGFGLPKCWRIITSHGGRIEAESVPGEATTFTVRWPASEGTDQG